MRVPVTLALGLLLLSVEVAVVRALGLSSARIDVTVVLVGFLALTAGTLEGAVGAFGLGYLLDLLSGRPTGLYTFLAVFLFLVGRLAASLVDVRSAGAFALYCVALDAAHGLLAALLSGLVTPERGAVSTVLWAIPLQVALTGAAAVLLNGLLRKIDRSEGQKKPTLGTLL